MEVGLPSFLGSSDFDKIYIYIYIYTFIYSFIHLCISVCLTDISSPNLCYLWDVFQLAIETTRNFGPGGVSRPMRRKN